MDPQAIMVRRAVAAVVAVLVVVLLALAIHSCEISQRNSALRDYTNNVSTLIQQSDGTGQALFRVLSGGASSGNANALQNAVNQARSDADTQLNRARGLSVPDEMKGAQQNVVLAMQMRDDGLTDIAKNIQPALGNSTSRDAIKAIAADMARFYASDVVYTLYATPQIAGALNAASISGESIGAGQFVPTLQWLNPSYVAQQLNVSSAGTPPGKPAPGVHGHKMDSCSVAGTQLQTSSTNTIPASPPATFTCLFTNDGTNPEHNIVVKVSVSGTSVSGQTTIASDTPGGQSTATVTLSSAPPPGTYTVSATVERVPGETTVTHNTLSFPVTFQ